MSYSSPGTVSEHRTYVYNAADTHTQGNVYTGGPSRRVNRYSNSTRLSRCSRTCTCTCSDLLQLDAGDFNDLLDLLVFVGDVLLQFSRRAGNGIHARGNEARLDSLILQALFN